MLKIAALSVALMVQSWTFVLETSDGLVVEIDYDNVSAVDGKPAVWTKRTVKDGSFTVVQTVYDCIGRTSGFRSIVSYDAKGRNKGTTSIPPFLIEMEPVVPETIGFAIFQKVCAR